jgi:hypothetical protein
MLRDDFVAAVRRGDDARLQQMADMGTRTKGFSFLKYAALSLACFVDPNWVSSQSRAQQGLEAARASSAIPV